MSHNRIKHPSDKQQGSTTDRSTSNKKASNQSSEELNRNEERTSPNGSYKSSQQWNQKSEDRDRSTGTKTPLTERTDITSKQWNQQSMQRDHVKMNVPGSEMRDQKNPNAQLGQTSKDDYPTSKKSSPTPEMQTPDQQYTGTNQDRKGYTGNSERSGQQYSESENTSERPEKNLKTGHPERDLQRTHKREDVKRPVSSNNGSEQRPSETLQRRDKNLKTNADGDRTEE